MKKSFGAESDLIAGKNGIFDVKVDGKLVYSKHETGRFPNKGEVTALLEKAQSK